MLVGGGESTHLRPQPTALELIVRTVGMTRARVKIGLANLAYNFSRLTWLQAQTAAARGHRAGSPNIGYPRTSGAALDSSQNPCRRLPADHLLKTGFLEVSTRTKRWATARPASSGTKSWRKRPRRRSALRVECMNAQRPWMRSGQGRSLRRRWRVAPALTRAQPRTTPNTYSLSDYSGATTTPAEATIWTNLRIGRLCRRAAGRGRPVLSDPVSAANPRCGAAKFGACRKIPQMSRHPAASSLTCQPF